LKTGERFLDPAWRPRVIFLQGYVSRDPEPTPSPFVKAQEQSLRDIGVDVVPFFVDGRRVIKYPGSIGRFRRMARESGADVVHAHFVYNGMIALCQHHLPTVISFLGGDVLVRQFASAGKPLRAAMTYAMTQAAAYAADEVIVKSDGMRDRVWRKRHVHVVPNGVSLRDFVPMPRDEARRELGLSEGKRYVLFSASPRRLEKDYALAEAALAVARRSVPEAEMLILEGVPHAQVPLYLNAADALLFTSKSEGSPNTVKEAMACNLPIVSVNVGDVRNVVDGTARCAVIGSRSPDELAARLTEILATGGERSNGRDRIARLDSRIVAEQLVALYREAILRRAGLPAPAPTHSIV